MRKEVIAHKDPKSPISEVFRTLRTNIQFMNANKKMKTLLVTSTFPGEGKSWVTSNLAVIFAQAGKKVVLVDADMRKGRQYAIFGKSPRPGLSNYLSQVEIDEKGEVLEEVGNYIQETEVPNLYLIPAGNVPPNPSELLISTQMTRLLDELKNIFDIVIVDSTPCELVTDAIILSRVVDSTIVVTAHKVTKKDALERLIKSIQNVGGNLLGVVVNKIPVSGKKYEEKYYYYGKEPNFFDKQRKKKGKSNYNKVQSITKRTKIEATNKQRISKIMKTKNNVELIKNVVSNSINTKENEELSKALKNTKSENTEEISLETTNDILRQINQYSDQEKENLKD